MASIRKAALAQTLTKLMHSKNKTVADLSRELNIPYTTINDWVKGETYPREDKLNLIANYFNVDADALLIGKIRTNTPNNEEYVSVYLEGIPQVEPYIQLLDAYQNADEKTRMAVNVLLDLDYARIQG